MANARPVVTILAHRRAGIWRAFDLTPVVAGVAVLSNVRGGRRVRWGNCATSRCRRPICGRPPNFAPPAAVEMATQIEGQPRWTRAPHPTPLAASGKREGSAEREGEGQPVPPS